MSSYLVEVIVEVRNFITVEADDENHAILLAKLQKGEYGQSSAPEFTFKRPKLLGDANGE